ncbi:MAG: multidrug efflux RND transporter permease subunit [Candidatus Xenobia bacterium]
MSVFIHRPVLSIVISLVILLAGGLAILALPSSQYPDITPPTVQVLANYTGADAQTVEETVAAPIEQQVNGAESMIYMQSKSTNDGRMNLTVSFEVGRDPDLASVDVQNRVNLALPFLPPEVTQQGVSVKKQSTQILIFMSFFSPGGTYDASFLSNYVLVNVIDELARLPGVGLAVILVGQQDYAMRMWVDPARLTSLGLTTTDLANALKEQNVQAAAGSVGAEPMPRPVDFQYSVNVKGRLTEAEEFGNIILRTNPDGSILRMKDVARVEMGSKTYNTFGRLNGQAAIPVGIYLMPGANSLATSKAVREKLEQLKTRFPPDVDYELTLDTTDFVTASIHEVILALRDAIILVILVVFVFLGNFRATLIPMLAVPVSLIGTFAAFVAFGFSINMLTLFGLVLAVGIVVDDAIVVVEAVEHHIEHGLSPLQATERAMAEVGGPVVAIALVLTSVFVPVAFMGGITGLMYRQFALTLAVSVCLSALVALTLTPALCTLILRPRKPMRGPLGWFLAGFNKVFDWVNAGYTRTVRLTIKLMLVTLCLLGVVFYIAYRLQVTLPTGFLPGEDNGYFMIDAQLPEASSLSRTNEVLKHMEEACKKQPGVKSVLGLGGYSLMMSTYNTNSCSIVVVLEPWEERTPEEHAFKTIERLQAEFSKYPEARIAVFNPPPIPGLGNAGGFTFELQDRSGGDILAQADTAKQFIFQLNQQKQLKGVFTLFSTNVPMVKLWVDRDKVKVLGIPLSDVFAGLQANLGGYYVNQFNKFGRTWQVYIQAEADYRRTKEDIGSLYVRAKDGSMVPLKTLTAPKVLTGADTITRFNLYRAVEVNGNSAPGYSSGQAIATVEKMAKSLPSNYSVAWTTMAYQEKAAQGSQGVIFLLALLFVFLFLSAQYESWAVPFAVLFGIPVGVMGAYIATAVIKMDNNLYVQIGLVMLIGLAAKNAILIVEFAKEKYEKEGFTLVEAAVEGGKLRLRPILMTSFAFILGVVPLVVAEGAGAVSRRALGTAVFGGMLAASTLGVFFIPSLYVLVQGIANLLGGKPKPPAVQPAEGHAEGHAGPAPTPAPKPEVAPKPAPEPAKPEPTPEPPKSKKEPVPEPGPKSGSEEKKPEEVKPDEPSAGPTSPES